MTAMRIKSGSRLIPQRSNTLSCRMLSAAAPWMYNQSVT